jgi:signal transduction histidine kinase
MTVRSRRRTVRVAVTATSPAAPPHRFAGLAAGDRRRAIWPALALAVLEVVGTIGASQGQPEARDLDPLALVLVLAAPVALVWRRTRPEVALGVAFASVMAYLALDYPKGPIFLGLIAAYVNAVVLGWRRLAVAVLVGGYVLVAWVMPAFDDGPWPDWSVAGALAAWLLVLGSASELIRVQLERAGERQAARAEEARRRASEERLRIARELHDVLAHNISLINVRAGVALHLVDDNPDAIDPAQVRPALAAIKDASKEALGELRSVLDVLRQDEAAPLAPTAGLADLDGLAERARGTGLDVRVERVNGDGRTVPAEDITGGLPAGVDLAAFRIAQEALTNVVRHAAASRATVRLRRTPDLLEVQVDDDGTGAADAPLGPTDAGFDRGEGGRGITGMRERAQALGGTAEAGPRPGRGFRVRARFPLATRP